MSRKITDAEIEEMFVAWQEKQTLRYVAQKCKVSLPTVRRYRDLENWADRLNKIQVTAKKKVNDGISDLRADQLLAGTTMRELGIKRLHKTKPEDIDPRLAKDLIVSGVTIEKEAVGDIAPDTVIVLALPVGLEGL